MDDAPIRPKQPKGRPGHFIKALSYKELRKIAVRYACKAGYREHAEDFAQQFLIDIFQGRNTHLKYHFIDFMRANIAYVKSKKGHAKYMASREDGGLYLKEAIQIIDPGQFQDDALIKNHLKGYDRLIVLLSVIYGLDQPEIADLFGVSANLICMQLKTAFKTMREKLKDVK